MGRDCIYVMITKPPLPWWKSKTIMTAAAAQWVIILWAIMVSLLFFLPVAAFPAFQAISLYAFSVFGVIICWGLGMKNIDRIFTMKTEAASLATSAVERLSETREEKIEIIRTPKAEHFDGEDIP